MMRLLQLSLLLNLVLAGLTWWRTDTKRAVVDEPCEQIVPPENRRFMRVARALTQVSAPPTPWAALENRDPTEMLANLRSIGCPETTIRDLMYCRIGRAYRDRLLRLERATSWTWDYTRYMSLQDNNDLEAERRVLNNEMLAQVESVLGQPFDTLAEQVFGFMGWSAEHEEYLPLSKRRQVREVLESLRAQRDVFRHRQIVNALAPAEEALLADSWWQEEAQLATILTPHEMEEWFYRESPAAIHARVHLAAARSEAEFREMVLLAHKYGIAHRPKSLSMIMGRYGFSGIEEDPRLKEYQQREAAFSQELRQILDQTSIDAAVH